MRNNDVDELSALYEEACQSMTVGDKKTGDLDGPVRDVNNGTGADNTDATNAKDAEPDLQGDTVAKSTDKGGKKVTENTAKPMSKFDALFKQTIEEELESIEGDGYSDDVGDFPAAGEDMADAEMGEEDPEGEETEADLFGQLADIFSKLATKFGGGDELDLGDGMAEGESLELESVESTPAPDGVTARTARSAMNTNAVKTAGGGATSNVSGAVDGGKAKPIGKAKDRNPKMSNKAKGSGTAVDGRNVSAFE